MKESDFEAFSAIMVGLAENYGQSLSPAGMVLRFKALSAHSIKEVEAAALSIIMCRKYTSMPTIADFLEHTAGGSVEDKGEAEAGKVLAAISKIGAYQSVVFDDAVTQAVIVLAYGGWIQLCQTCGVEEPEKWFRKDFARIWSAYQRMGIRQTGHLAGVFEIENGAKGLYEAIPAPHAIGDMEKAKAVREAGFQLCAFQSGILPEEAAPQNLPVVRGKTFSTADLPSVFPGLAGKKGEDDAE